MLSPYREVVIREFQEHKVPLNMDVEMPTVETIRSMVQRNSGRGVSAAHVRGAGDRAARLLCEVRVKEMHVERKIWLVYPTRRALSHAARAFLELVQSNPQPAEGR